jgi:hypothetical protein
MTPAAADKAGEGAPLRPVQTPAEAHHLTGHLVDVMDALLGIVEEETGLVRPGRLRAAADLETAKEDLTRH